MSNLANCPTDQEAIEKLQARVKELEERNNGFFQQLGQTGCDLENEKAKNAKLRRVVDAAKEYIGPNGHSLETGRALEEAIACVATVNS